MECPSAVEQNIPFFDRLYSERSAALLHQILTLEELRVNPFRDRICKVFSEDDSGDLSFEDFLDLMSVFSEGATRDVKASYAFRIYGILAAVDGLRACTVSLTLSWGARGD